MMKHLAVWVEGAGDEAAVPILLNILLKQAAKRHEWHVAAPVKVGELPKVRKLLPRLVGDARNQMQQGKCHGILILLDLDDATACPVSTARILAAELAAFNLPYPVAVVFARREYEEWLVASLPTIAPQTPLLPDDLRRDYPPESKRGVKEWLGKHSGSRYLERLHQAEFTRHLDPALAAECRSFRRLQSAVAELLAGTDVLAGVATPQP